MTSKIEFIFMRMCSSDVHEKSSTGKGWHALLRLAHHERAPIVRVVPARVVRRGYRDGARPAQRHLPLQPLDERRRRAGLVEVGARRSGRGVST